jgi:hypothetical protein
MIVTNRNKGFHLTFNNGLTISVQIGVGNYCNNQNHSLDYDFEQKQAITKCDNAEIAIWDNNNVWFKFDNDTVKGWVNTEEVGIWIDRVRRAKSIKTIKRIK